MQSVLVVVEECSFFNKLQYVVILIQNGIKYIVYIQKNLQSKALLSLLFYV